MSMILVPREAEGMTITPIKTLAGEETNELHLDGVRLRRTPCSAPKAAAGRSSWPGSTTSARSSPPPRSGSRSARSTTPSPTPRSAASSGARSAPFQAISHKFAELATEIERARLLVRWVASLTDEDPDRMLPAIASVAKLAVTELAKRCAFEGMQITGGYGYAVEYPMERNLRSSLVTTIYGGTSGLQKNTIAKALGV